MRGLEIWQVEGKKGIVTTLRNEVYMVYSPPLSLSLSFFYTIEMQGKSYKLEIPKVSLPRIDWREG